MALCLCMSYKMHIAAQPTSRLPPLIAKGALGPNNAIRLPDPWWQALKSLA